MITVDGRIFDTDLRWKYWCKEHGIIDPFKERDEHDAYQHRKEIINGHEVFVWDKDNSPEYKAWHEDWEKRRDEYLRQQHTFRLWDFHFWMDWERFEKFIEHEESFTDISIYLPCDCANRQCSLTCAYFGEKCPRENEELKCPIPGLEGRYEI